MSGLLEKEPDFGAKNGRGVVASSRALAPDLGHSAIRTDDAGYVLRCPGMDLTTAA